MPQPLVLAALPGFERAETSYAPGGGAPFRFGVQVDIANGGSVSFSRDEDGRLVVRWRLGERRSWSEPEVLGAWPQDGGAHTLAIAIDRDEQEVVLLLDVNGEMCVFDKGGVPARGLTNGSSAFARSLGEPVKRVLPFASRAKGGEVVDIWADAGCAAIGYCAWTDGKMGICQFRWRSDRGRLSGMVKRYSGAAIYHCTGRQTRRMYPFRL